ncbi:7 transmembrane sweet-taste receptor of 3 GCPR family protein [Acanthocheilonema viteae]
MLTQPFDYLRFIFIILLAGDLPVLFGRQVFLRGDIILGGLFPVHEAGLNGSECGVLKAAQGVQRLQAMIYALDLVNNDETILPGIVLGAQILDTCSVDSYALEQTLVFIKTIMSQTDEIYCSDGSKPIYQHHPVAAVIGAASSQVSVMVASMLQLFKVPQISYSSTGTELSEKPRFAYFSRVVPPDNLQATAMAHVVSALGWTYVHAIAITGSYGERGIDSFRAAAAELGVCIDGDVHKINRRWTDIQFKELFFKMKYTKKARGVVMFVDEDQLRRMLSSLDDIRREDSTFDNYFWWIASDSWGIKQSVITGYETMISGAVTISPDLKVVPDFDRYFKKLWPSNTFLREYWELINCTDEHTNFEKCFDKHGITFKQEAYVPFVIDAVNVVARALHQYIQTTCSSLNFRNCNVSKIDFDGARLQSYYRNVSIAPGVPPHIDANGDGIGNYNIYQLNDVGHYQNVGKWTAGKKLDLNVRRVRKGLKRWDGLLPLSVCSTDCPRGYYRAYQDQNCCWTCIPCDVSTSVIINETSCVQCPLGYAPNEDLVACNLISPTTLEYNSPWVVLPAICSTLGIAATLFVIAVFVRYSNTPVIMASGRELCYFMLGGILLCYLVTFVLVSKPNVAICAASRILIGLSMSAIYAAILTKTNLLARIFLMQSVGRLDCIVPSAQIAICFGIVSIQLIGSLVWLVIDPPGTDVLFPSRKETILTCKARASHLLISLLYNMFLIIACTLYAFKTRKIPENFNETRLIGFTMYSTSILWLSFGPIYFATQNNFKIQITSLCMCISMSGTVALCCFFVPKVYIAVCQPYKNVRMRQSAVGRLVNQQMRFISQIATTTAPNNSTLSTSVIDCSSYPHFASCNIVEAEKNSIISSQTTKQYGTASLAVIKKSSDKCSVNSDKNDNTCRINNAGSHENSPLMKTTLFLHQSSDDELAKETIMYQNNAELFFEQLFVNYDVTFL